MAEIADLAKNPFAEIERAAAAEKAYKANPENVFARIEQASAKGVELDTEAPVGQAGFLGGVADIGRGLARGAISTLPEQLGKAATFFGAPETGKTLQQFGEEQAKAHPELKQSQVGQIAAGDDLSLRGGAYQAGEMTPLSQGPALAGAAIGGALGSVAGPPGAVAGAGAGYIVGSLAALPIFYGSQAQETKESVKKGLLKKGVPEAEAESQSTTAGHLSGAVEAGGELVADIIPFKALFNPLAKAVKGQLVKSTLTGVGKKVAGAAAGTVAAEVGTEMAQTALEDQIEKQYGGEGPGATWKSTLSVVVPTALMSIIPGGFTAAHNFKTNFQVKGALANPEADPEQRAAAASMIFHSIKGVDPLAAHAFDVYAANAIGRNEPIELKDDAQYKADLLHWMQNPGESIVNPSPFATAPDTAATTVAKQFGIDETQGPVSAAAATALNTGASGEAQVEREQEAAAADQEGAIPPAGDENKSYPLEDAYARRDELEAQTGKVHEVLPDPTNHQQYLVKPTDIPAPPSEEAVGEAEKAGDQAIKEQDKERKLAWSGLDRRLKLFGAEAKDLEQKAKASAGEGEPQLPAIHKALTIASQAHWDATAATRAMKVALDAKRIDIVHAIVERAQRVAEEANQMKPSVPPDSGVYGAIEKALAKRAAAAQRDADKLLTLSKLQPETGDAVQKPSTGGVLPHPPEGIGGPGGERGGVGPGLEGETPTETGQGKTTAGPSPVGPGQDQQGHPPNVPGPEAPAAGEGQGPVTQPQPPGSAEIDEPPGPVVGGPGPEGPTAGPAPEPTGPQIEAGNYKKEHITAAGFPIALESKEGMTRKSKPGVEPAWETTIQKAHYGYIKGTNGNDDEQVDTFVKPDTTPEHDGPVFVIDQTDKESGFDEHKVMLGYGSQPEAVAAYKANYPAGWNVGNVTQTTRDELKRWLAEGDTAKPFSEREKDPLDTLVDYDKIEETDDNIQPTGRYAAGKVPARDALADIEERLSFAKAMRECLGV